MLFQAVLPMSRLKRKSSGGMVLMLGCFLLVQYRIHLLTEVRKGLSGQYSRYCSFFGNYMQNANIYWKLSDNFNNNINNNNIENNGKISETFQES